MLRCPRFPFNDHISIQLLDFSPLFGAEIASLHWLQPFPVRLLDHVVLRLIQCRSGFLRENPPIREREREMDGYI